MIRTLVFVICTTLILGSLVAGCDEDNGITPDQGAAMDKSVLDLPASDSLAAVDGPVASDGPVADGPGTPDGPVAVDGPVTSDGPVADGPAAPDGPAADGPVTDGPVADLPVTEGPITACLMDSACALANNCCECNAYPAGQVPPCLLPCMTKTCTQTLGLSNPEAICVKGHCLVNDSAGCSSDADCKLINDCCRCWAVAATVATPPCSYTCWVDTCTSLGISISTAKAACVSGFCRLVP